MALKTNSFNAGSMADIAFTLLIFFIVSTTLADEKGVVSMLPKWEKGTGIEINTRNIFSIEILENGEVMVEEKGFNLKLLKTETVTFMMNNGQNPNYSDSYNDGVVHIKIHPNAPYDKYVEVLSNVKAGFQTIRNEYALETYQKQYDWLNETQAREVRKKYPLKIAEQTIAE